MSERGLGQLDLPRATQAMDLLGPIWGDVHNLAPSRRAFVLIWKKDETL
jgi:hypothetical protein